MIVYSHLLFCMDSTLETYMPRVKGFNRFWELKLVMNFGRFGQTMYSNLWMVYETFTLVGQNVIYHHTIMCALHVLLKGILLKKCFTNGTLIKFYFVAWFFWKNQTKLVVGHHAYGEKLVGMWLYVHPCPELEVTFEQYF